jgi:hypothetical protein
MRVGGVPRELSTVSPSGHPPPGGRGSVAHTAPNAPASPSRDGCTFASSPRISSQSSCRSSPARTWKISLRLRVPEPAPSYLGKVRRPASRGRSGCCPRLSRAAGRIRISAAFRLGRAARNEASPPPLPCRATSSAPPTRERRRIRLCAASATGVSLLLPGETWRLDDGHGWRGRGFRRWWWAVIGDRHRVHDVLAHMGRHRVNGGQRATRWWRLGGGAVACPGDQHILGPARRRERQGGGERRNLAGRQGIRDAWNFDRDAINDDGEGRLRRGRAGHGLRDPQRRATSGFRVRRRDRSRGLLDWDRAVGRGRRRGPSAGGAGSDGEPGRGRADREHAGEDPAYHKRPGHDLCPFGRPPLEDAAR